jgi:hypothetical protein
MSDDKALDVRTTAAVELVKAICAPDNRDSHFSDAQRQALVDALELDLTALDAAESIEPDSRNSKHGRTSWPKPSPLRRHTRPRPSGKRHCRSSRHHRAGDYSREAEWNGVLPSRNERGAVDPVQHGPSRCSDGRRVSVCSVRAVLIALKFRTDSPMRSLTPFLEFPTEMPQTSRCRGDVIVR